MIGFQCQRHPATTTTSLSISRIAVVRMRRPHRSYEDPPRPFVQQLARAHPAPVIGVWKSPASRGRSWLIAVDGRYLGGVDRTIRPSSNCRKRNVNRIGMDFGKGRRSDVGVLPLTLSIERVVFQRGERRLRLAGFLIISDVSILYLKNIVTIYISRDPAFFRPFDA